VSCIPAILQFRNTPTFKTLCIYTILLHKYRQAGSAGSIYNTYTPKQAGRLLLLAQVVGSSRAGTLQLVKGSPPILLGRLIHIRHAVL